jgi:hypothetical protein
MKKTILFLLIIIFSASLNLQAQDESKQIFEDGFSKNENNWREASDMYFKEGAYHIYNNEIGKLSFRKFQDKTMAYRNIEVIAVFNEGLSNQGYGVLFGALDIDNGYMFLIAAEGYYSMGKLVGGSYSTLINWTYNENIRKKARNNIKIDFSSDQVSIFLNNVRIVNEFYSIPTDGGAGFYSAKGVHSSFELLRIKDHKEEWIEM